MKNSSTDSFARGAGLIDDEANFFLRGRVVGCEVCVGERGGAVLYDFRVNVV